MEPSAGSVLPGQAALLLSGRQVRLLRLLCEGHQYKTAAATLGVTVNTVRFHVRNLYARLGVHSKCEAVVRALGEDLVR